MAKMMMTVVTMAVIAIAGMRSILFMYQGLGQPALSLSLTYSQERLIHLLIHPHFTDQVVEPQGYTACVKSLR